MQLDATAWWMAGAGDHPLLQFGAIVIGSYLLEDAATVLAAGRASEGGIPVGLALAAVYSGIFTGDLGAYALGRLAARWPWLDRHVPERLKRPARQWLEDRLMLTVFVVRFMPGVRLPTYTACGYLGMPFARFMATALLATLVWTSLLFFVSIRVGEVMREYLGVWRWAGFIGLAVFIVAIGRLAVSRWMRDAHSDRTPPRNQSADPRV